MVFSEKLYTQQNYQLYLTQTFELCKASKNNTSYKLFIRKLYENAVLFGLKILIFVFSFFIWVPGLYETLKCIWKQINFQAWDWQKEKTIFLVGLKPVIWVLKANPDDGHKEYQATIWVVGQVALEASEVFQRIERLISLEGMTEKQNANGRDNPFNLEARSIFLWEIQKICLRPEETKIRS